MVSKKPRNKKGHYIKEDKVYRDNRLDKIMPILTEILTRLLGSAGMVRYRKDFTDKVKEIMNEESNKKKDSAEGQGNSKKKVS